MKRNSYIITGGSGFLGSHIIKELLSDENCEIIAILRDLKGAQKLEKSLKVLGGSIDRVSLVYGELCDYQFCSSLFKSDSIVIHAAAQVSLSSKNGHQLIKNNVSITETVVEAALKADVRRFIQISSIATLGEAQYPAKITENSQFTTISGKNSYTISKFYCENIVWGAVERGLKATILSPAVIIGSGVNGGSSSDILNYVKRGSKFYSEGVTGYVSALDVAKAVAVASKNENGVAQRYILCSENISFKELLERGAKIASKNPPKYRVSPKCLLYLKKIIEALNFIGISTKITPSIVDNLSKKIAYDGTKFSEEFDFKYTKVI